MTSNNKKNLFNLANPIQFLALGFGSGLSPKAPGTFGTLAAIPLYLVLINFSTVFYAMATIFVCIAGVYICGKAAEQLGVHDHPAIVWDEIAGFLITMFMIPFSMESLVLGFLLFRFFDIIKPWPISFIDKKLQGGFGIMFDDIIAGLFALIVMQFVF